jgi:exosome complex component RRP4
MLEVKMDKRIVIPGDFLSDDIKKAGEGTFIKEGKVYANLYGLINEKNKIRVVPISGKYFPSAGDLIIATVSEITYSNWIMDIKSPYEGLLHISEYSRRIESDEMMKYLNMGDSVLVMVKEVSPSMKIELTMRDSRLKPITNGRLIEVTPSKVPRIIGRGGSMISMLKNATKCNIFVGQNGVIWITGKEKGVNKAIETIILIETHAHTNGLTERISKFLKGNETSEVDHKSPDILNELLD